MPLTLSPEKAVRAREFAAALKPGQRVCITTHVNPDGDGLGSEVGLIHLLRGQGIQAIITNPSPTPPRFGFLFEGLSGVDRSGEAVKELRRADLIVVLESRTSPGSACSSRLCETAEFPSPALTTT